MNKKQHDAILDAFFSNLHSHKELETVRAGCKQRLWEVVLETSGDVLGNLETYDNMSREQVFKAEIPPYVSGIVIDKEEQRACFVDIEGWRPQNKFERMEMYWSTLWNLDALCWGLDLIVIDSDLKLNHVDVHEWERVTMMLHDAEDEFA